MDILTANKNMTGGGSGVVACVIDTGIEPVGWLVGRAYAVNYDSDTKSYYEPHGTNVSSVIIDHCPEALVYSYNVFGGRSQVDSINSALADIVVRVKADKARRYVVNMSLAGDGNSTKSSSIARMESLIDQLVALDVPVIVAAGNDNQDALGNKYPSCFQSPICVSALNKEWGRAWFSSWHNEVDFAEIGMGVRTLEPDGGSGTGSGTSFSAPVVAAKCATLLSRYPKMTEPELFEVLKANAQDIGDTGFDPYFGWGWIAGLDVSKVAEPIEPIDPEEPDEPKEGTMLTAAQLIAYFQRAVAEGWGYVWSLNGEMYSQAIAQKYHDTKRPTNSNRKPETYWLTDCAKWIGKMAADCSGGIVGAIRTVNPSYDDRTADTFFGQCTETGKIATIPEIPGLCVWRKDHIGVYEGNGNVLEFRGTDYGAVRTKLKERTFTHWGRLRDIKYEEDTDMAKIITLQSPLMRGDDIKALQVALNALGYPCGDADGIAGSKTIAAIKAFNGAHGAAVEVPAELPESLTLAITIGSKTYTSEMK